jgi:hypothetical protein
MKKISAILLLAATVFTIGTAVPANAWDGSASGKISRIDVTDASNYGMRVYLTGVSHMCTGGADWAYLNESDSNYKVYVAALMMAKAQGSTVIIDSNLQGSYCHIGYIAVTN